MQIILKNSGIAVVARILAEAIMPPEKVSPTEWARKNLIVPDGPQAGEPWDDGLTPYIREPLDMTDTAQSGINEIAIRKSAQTGFTTLLIASAGHMIVNDPCRAMIVQPTIGALTDFNRDKLGQAIEQSKDLKARVHDQKERDGGASTTRSKRYPGGSITLAIATSAADLRSKTIKKAYLDEIDEYPDDLDNQGDPIAMVEARQESFLMSAEWLRLYVSTPTIKGASKIARYFEAGDQRYWNMPCPHCGDPFKFVFDRKHFRFNDAFPYEAHYVTPCCGGIIEGYEKIAVIRKGRWVAEARRPGAFPSYHFDALSSPFVPWDKIAERFLAAADDPAKMKTFFNLTLGLEYDMRGDAPDHVRLMARRDSSMKRGHIPAPGLILVGAADVQMNGIWYSIRAFAADRQSWVVDAGYLEGPTDDPHSGPFLRLEEIRTKQWPDAFGRARTVDAFGVDSGFRSHIVYTWVRGKIATFALKGLDGWSRPAIGQPTAVDIDFRGQRIRGGANVWGVGTWSLKGAFYADLRKEGISEGQEMNPPGHVHFGSWMDEVYFRQITSEYLGSENFKGRVRRVWKVRAGEENHLLDCEIYINALADYLGVSRMTSDQWRNLASMRGVPDSVLNPDLFAPAPLRAQAEEAPSPGRQLEPPNNDLSEVVEDRLRDFVKSNLGRGGEEWFDGEDSFWD